MIHYQALARRYRPQIFGDVLGQDAIVTTLVNAIKYGKVAHAYLFCGARGTGKTTLARLFAKALNCTERDQGAFEPCNSCSSCKEITAGNSLDVIEIDGASHRGIDDVRRINETIGYATSSGNYRIYIIDEVHMLTREAFNALLKTLEEPPAKALFFFATTESHKIPPTILSRCQRYNLSRIPLATIEKKIKRITNELGVVIEDEAIKLIADLSEGCMRDAESLLDQVIAYHEGKISLDSTAEVLGVVSEEHFFALDKAGQQGDINAAFLLADKIFREGKDIAYFLDTLVVHFRNLLAVILNKDSAAPLPLSAQLKEKYEVSSKIYTKEQCLYILDNLMGQHEKLRFSVSQKVALELILMNIIRSHNRISIEQLVSKLAQLEQQLAATPPQQPSPQPKPELKQQPKLQPKQQPPSLQSIDLKEQSRYDTLLQFAAVELQGTIKKK
ncbi:DNA polymerase III subunit gamma/tau [Simkania negevensis]|uniref:DNA polymerase III subunit gamma/tau n=1 Tax=Simkania negevensis TaxID=83561 RepID=A0ABS3AR28_9BACT|nr:DNA polymerase III subunit gamma/tau [Simkania negevensis]